MATPRSWAAKGIYGEKLWLLEPERVPPDYRVALRWRAIPALVGFGLMAWGLVALLVWPTAFGATLLVLAQLWRIDRLGLLCDSAHHAEPR